jgi:hypothetical protein
VPLAALLGTCTPVPVPDKSDRTVAPQRPPAQLNIQIRSVLELNPEWRWFFERHLHRSKPPMAESLLADEAGVREALQRIRSEASPAEPDAALSVDAVSQWLRLVGRAMAPSSLASRSPAGRRDLASVIASVALSRSVSRGLAFFQSLGIPAVSSHLVTRRSSHSTPCRLSCG